MTEAWIIDGTRSPRGKGKANGSLHGIKVPEFARAVGRFPNGFEVKIDGTGAGKLVLFRYVVESTVQNKRKVFSEVRRMVCTDG